MNIVGLVAETQPKAQPGRAIEPALENDKQWLKLDTALPGRADSGVLKAKGLLYRTGEP